jgi:hypothetical protein
LFASSEIQKEHRQRVASKVRSFASRVLEEVAKNKSFRHFSSHLQRIEIIRKAEAAQKCVDAFGQSCTNFAQIAANLSILESAVKSVYDRMAENQTVVLAFSVLRSTIELAKNSSRIEWPRTKPFLDPRTVEAFRALVEETEQWLDYALNVTRKREPWKGFDIGVDQYHIRTARLFDAYQKIEATERPKKRTGRKIPKTPAPKATNEEVPSEPIAEGALDYEYEPMTDDEALAMYAGQEWTDLFPASNYAIPDDSPEYGQALKSFHEMQMRATSMKLRDVLVKKHREWEEHESAAKKAEEREAFDNL